jgi:hypothetical protein
MSGPPPLPSISPLPWLGQRLGASWSSTRPRSAPGIQPPPWLAMGARPPYVRAATWSRLPREDQRALLEQARADWDRVFGLTPQWLLQGLRPPSMPVQSWSRLAPEDRAPFVERLREAWRAQMDVLLHGLPDGEGGRVEPYLMQVPSGLTSNQSRAEYGWGVAGEWLEYQGSPNAAQYLNLEAMFGAGYPQVNFNLCGPLAVLPALGEPLLAGLRSYDGLTQVYRDKGNTTGAEVLRTGETTWSSDLRLLYQAAGWSAEVGGHYPDATPTAEEMAVTLRQRLDDGLSVNGLANIDGSDGSGRLRPVGDGAPDNDAHWVRVLAFERVSSGESIVLVYNPYHNREEVYSWETFQAAWRDTEENNRNYIMVAAQRPTAGG